MDSGMKYRTSRLSFLCNYILSFIVLIFLSMVAPLFTGRLLDVVIYGSVFAISFLLLEPESKRWVNEYYVTKNEVIESSGVFSKKTIVLPYQSVSDVRIEQDFFGRLLNLGDIQVTGFKGEIRMKGMKNPEEVYRIFQNKLGQYRKVPFEDRAQLGQMKEAEELEEEVEFEETKPRKKKRK